LVLSAGGVVRAERARSDRWRGRGSADKDGLAGLVVEFGRDVRAVVEMMSGAVWVRDRLTVAGWEVNVAHARKAYLDFVGGIGEDRIEYELALPRESCPPCALRRAARTTTPRTTRPRPRDRGTVRPECQLTASARGRGVAAV
jgi:hypothetical protein